MNSASVRLHPDLIVALRRLAKIENLPFDVLLHLLIGEAVLHRLAKEGHQPPRRLRGSQT